MLKPRIVLFLSVATLTWAVPLPRSSEPDACLPAMRGNGVCDLACHHPRFDWDNGDCNTHDECDRLVGMGYLRAMKESNTSLCTGTGRRESGASMTFIQDQGCEGSALSNVVELRNARVVWESDARQFAIKVQCGDDSFGRVDSETLGFGGSRLVADAATDPESICRGTWVTEPTLLVVNPRGEWFNNLYHALEEFFSLFETSWLLGLQIRDLRLVFLKSDHGNGPLTLQFPGQVADRSLAPHSAFLGRPQIYDLYNQLLARGGPDHPTFMAPLTAVEHSPLCFRHLVLPIRACKGTVLPRTWNTSPHCGATGNPIARAVSDGVFHAFGKHTATQKAFSGPVEITVVARSRDGGRPSTNMPDVVAALRSLPNVFVHEVLLEKLSMSDQLDLFSNTDILMGPHGAGLANVIFLPPHAALVEFTDHPFPIPFRSIGNIFAKMAEWTQHRYASVSNAASPDPSTVKGAVEQLIREAGAA